MQPRRAGGVRTEQRPARRGCTGGGGGGGSVGNGGRPAGWEGGGQAGKCIITGARFSGIHIRTKPIESSRLSANFSSWERLTTKGEKGRERKRAPITPCIGRRATSAGLYAEMGRAERKY